MASTNKTTNYDLSQYIGTDKPTYLSDYNGDMYKIDAQMKTNADNIATAISDAQSAISTANQANTTAGQANTTAQTANTTAGQANTTANNAQNTANSALSTATTAQTKANAVETAVGDLTDLETTDTTSVVNAINELVADGVYSTTEVDTGKKFINNKPIYRKVFDFTSNTNTSWTLLDTNDYENVIDVNGDMIGAECYIGIIKYLNFYCKEGKLYYQNQTTFSQNHEVKFWIEYTKSTD